MGEDYYQNALKGSRNIALETIDKIAADLQRYGKSGHKDARKHQLKFVSNVLTGICQDCADLHEKAHYDIYVDIFLRICSPCLDPAASAIHWKRILTLLEYLYLMLTAYQLDKEANTLHTYIHVQKSKWSDFDDAKCLLKIHGSHMQLQCALLNNTSSDKEAINLQAKCALDGLETLFVHLKKQQKKPAALLVDLLTQFTRYFVPKRSATQIHLATTLRTVEMERMYSAYFDLLSASVEIMPEDVSEPTVTSIYQKHLEAIRNFIQLDVYSKLQQQIALQYASICRKIKLLQQNEYISFCCALLYNFIKLAYLQTRIRNFSEAYTQLCSKFTQLLQQSGKVLIQHTWFQDFLVVMYFLFGYMQPNSSNTFRVYWNQMDGVAESHFELITSCFVLLSDVNSSKLIEYKCCESQQNWRHLQSGLLQIAVETYTYFLKELNVDTKKLFSTSSLQNNMRIIFKTSMDNLLSMDGNCTNAATEFKRFSYNFTSLTQSSKDAAQTIFYISLGEEMTRLKSRISTEDWLGIIRRIYKVGTVCEDIDIAAELHCCYIAELICSTAQPPFITLQNQLHFFYNSSADTLFKNGSCLTNIYSKSKSPFKPLLQKHEKRLLHWLEMQHVHKYYKREDYRALFMTLAQHSQTKYDFINAVHAGQLLDSEAIYTKIENIYDVLRNRKSSNSDTSPLTRFDELTFAHVASLLHFHRCESLKTNLSSKDFNEENLEVLIQDKTLSTLNVNNETDMVEKALESLRSFQLFFKKIDTEPLHSNESGYLDWSRIIEDLVSLAVYFQAIGYMDYAIEAWLLHYCISNTIDDLHSSLRSLAFFCEHPHYLQNHIELDLDKEISLKSAFITTVLKNLSQQLRRQQNFTLTCICQIAHYYASKQRFHKAIALIKLVKDQHSAKLEGEPKYDMVLFTADVVQFRILWKYLPNSTIAPQNYCHCLLHEIDVIIERMRSLVLTTSADAMPYSLLLMSAISDFAECAANRMSDNFLSGFFGLALKVMVTTGAAVRTALFLSKWAYINLQMEYLQKAEIKFQVIECILGLRSTKELASSLKTAKSCAVTASKQLHDFDSEYLLPIGVEEVRKEHVKTGTPLIMKKHSNNLMVYNRKLKSYLDVNRNVKHLDSPTVSEYTQWSQMILGCLRARYCFLADNSEELQSFYDESFKWQEQRRYTFCYKMFRSSILLSMLHYGNFLRKTQKYKMAIDYFEMCIKYGTAWVNEVDPFYLFNMKQQWENTKLEQVENEKRSLSKTNRIARCLTFDKSPQDMTTTPASKSSRCAPLHMTTGKSTKSKTAGFAIYNDNISPHKLKPPPVMKDLNFGQSSESGNSSSGSDTSVERKTQKPKPSNDEVIELSDSDDETKEKNNVDVKKAKEKLKNIKKSKIQFFESVELEEIDQTPSTNILVVPKTVKKQQQQTPSKTTATAEQLLVKEIEKLTIETTIDITKSSSKAIKKRTCVSKTYQSLEVAPNIQEINLFNTTPPSVASKPVTRKRNTKLTKSQSVETTPATTSSHLNSVEGSTGGLNSLRTRQTRAKNSETTTRTMTLRRCQRN